MKFNKRYNIKKLEEKGYFDDNEGLYIPYPNKQNLEFYLRISRTEGKSEVVYEWGKYDKKNFNVITMHKSRKLISQTDKNLIGNLQDAAENAGIKITDNFDTFVKNFLKNIRQVNGLRILKDKDYEFPKSSNDNIEEETFSFDNYPELIQEEALSIINNGTLYKKYIKSISITHAENTAAKEQLALILISLFVGEPINTELDAKTGRGKTDVTTETVKNIPDQYIHHLSTVSPKNIYYDRDSYGSFNIVIFDDVVLSDENITLLKVLSDNNKPVKELRTVIDKKPVNFILNGKFLVIITYAKDNPDEELLNRLYKLNINIADNSKSIIKNKIKDNSIINADDNAIISKSRLIIQAAIQYLIEQELTIFNPFATLFNPNYLENRNIKHFISMVLSKSFFNTNELKKINLAGKTIYIGSYTDFKYVAEIWAKEADTQKYKLNDKQKQVLSILDEKTQEEAIEYIESKLDEYNNASPVEQLKILNKLHTRKTIAKYIDIGESSVRNYLDRSQGTAKSLLDQGLIGRVRFNTNSTNSPWVYYKVKKNDENTLWQGRQIENATHFNTFKDKMKILLSLLYLANIAVNEEGYTYLSKCCEDENYNIDFNNYDTYYNFINDSLKDFDLDKYAIKIQDAKLDDLEYMIELFSSIEKKDEPQNSASFADHPKIAENASNGHTTLISNGDSNLPSAAKQWDSEKNTTSNEITHPSILKNKLTSQECSLLICGFLTTQDMNKKDLYRKLKNYTDLNKEDLNEMLIERLDSLEAKGVIISKENGYYHLRNEYRRY